MGWEGGNFSRTATFLLDVLGCLLVITWWQVKTAAVALPGRNQRSSRLAPDQDGHAPFGLPYKPGSRHDLATAEETDKEQKKNFMIQGQRGSIKERLCE